jgi:tetratricopeptide (TPR) repeat protein
MAKKSLSTTGYKNGPTDKSGQRMRGNSFLIRWPHLSVGQSCVCCVLIFSLSLRAQNLLPQPEPGELAPIDPNFDAPLSRGIALVYSDRFEESLALFDSLQKAHPDHPGPHFYKAAAHQTWMRSYRFNGFQKELEQNVEEAITKGAKLLRTTNDPWLLFYMGGAYGYRAFYKFRNYHWLDAYQDSRKSLNYIQTGLQKQPKLYDAYLGLGSYDYWSTAKSIFRELLKRLEGHRYQSIGYQVECKYRIAQALRQQGRVPEALALASSALALSKKRNAKVEMESDLGSFSDTLKALKRLGDELKKQMGTHSN